MIGVGCWKFSNYLIQIGSSSCCRYIRPPLELARPRSSPSQMFLVAFLFSRGLGLDRSFQPNEKLATI